MCKCCVTPQHYQTPALTVPAHRKAAVITAAKRFFSKPPDSNQDHGQAAAPSPDQDQNVYEEANADQESNVAEIRKARTSSEEKVLTLRQLLLRRGLALLVMVFILAVGVVASELLVRYLK